MYCTLLVLFAQATTPAAGGNQQASPGELIWQFAPLLLVGFAVYFVFWRPMQREKKQRELLVSQTKKNDEVLLTSGIFGTIVGVAEDKDEITVKIADNTRIRIIKSAILKNLTNEETLKAAQQPAAADTTPKANA